MRFISCLLFLVLVKVSIAQFERIEEAFSNSDYDGAIAGLNEIVKKGDDPTHYENIANASYWYGKCYFKKSESLKAYEHFIRSEYYTKFDSLTELNSKVQHELGDVLFKLGDFEGASKSYFQIETAKYEYCRSLIALKSPKAIAVYSSLPESKLTSELNMEFLKYLVSTDSLSLANQIGVSILNKAKSSKEIIGLCFQLGIVARKSGDYKKAERLYKQILKEPISLDVKSLAYSMLGVVEVVRKQFNRAKSQFETAIKIQKETKDKTYLGGYYNYLANLNLKLGEVQLALQNADKALSVLKEEAWKSRSTSHEILGKGYEFLGFKRKAAKHYKEGKGLLTLLNEQSRLNQKTVNAQLLKVEQTKNRTLESLQLQHYGQLAYQNMRLSNEAKERALKVLLSEKALEKEKMLVSKAELMARLRAREIKELSHKNQINNLLIEKQKLENRESEKELAWLKNTNEINALKLEVQNNQLSQQKLYQRLILALVVILLLTGGFVFYRFRVRQKNKEFQLTRRKMEVESLLFRAQMNPHFLFNSLNSIKGLILNAQTIDADKYLTKFAGLMRHILNNSEESFVAISKELEMIKLYMDLENLRFDDPFTYTVEIDEFIEEENSYIPSMIIQPHIENAILHGLKTRGKGGQINISFFEQEESIKVIVEDNGIGREQASEIRKASNKSHKSKATELIEKQITFFQEEQKTVDMKIVDLVEDDKPIGTRIELVLPLRLSLVPA